MVTIRQSHRDDYHSCPDLERVTESLLEPELLQSDLVSALDLALIFTCLVSLELDRAFGASVLELDLRTERPSGPVSPGSPFGVLELDLRTERPSGPVSSGSPFGVLELDLRAERPSFSEVVPKIDDEVRNVEPSVTFIVFILLRMVIPLPSVAIEVAGHHRLTVTTDCKSLSVSREASRNQ